MHTDSPETSVALVADVQPPSGLRRRIVGAGLIGLAGSLLPRLAGRAGASVPDDTTAATTTTAPPRQPTGDDATLLGFAQSAELAAVELYGLALDSGSLNDDTLAVVTMVHQSHVSYGQTLNALLGREAPGTSLAEVVEAFTEGFSGDEAAFLTAAYELEDTLVATHTDLIEQLQGTDGAALIASILIVEAQHATVFTDLAGQTDLDSLILTASEALVPGEG